ncbi:LacI family DNA-binding transcriptional regulator [Paenibacillus hodogayensis]|uniref:LacI family DNA-binding transcriptional regulator n=1 Tax=Paenibacillus hodogayensis TaxID=279208 RepID=A0ABV5VUW0_9BACL
MPKPKVTLHDLSYRLGLSIHTVSKALRGLPGMSEETRYAVNQMARQLGYRTKEQKRSLNVERIQLFPEVKHRFMLIIARTNSGSALNQMLLVGLQEKLSEFGHSIETVIAPETFDKDGAFEEWVDKHNIKYADGIFIPPLTAPGLESKLLSLAIPRIILNYAPPAVDADSVIWDVETAIYQSVRYFLEMGHTNVLFIGEKEARGHLLRWKTFVEAMRENGEDVHADDHVTDVISNKEQWMNIVTERLQRRKPTAILSALGSRLPWIYLACDANGLHIPDNCSLISLEHDKSDFVPQLSRPFLLIKETGVRGAERMLWRLANPHLPYEHTQLQGGFYRGETVKPLQRAGQGAFPKNR